MSKPVSSSSGSQDLVNLLVQKEQVQKEYQDRIWEAESKTENPSEVHKLDTERKIALAAIDKSVDSLIQAKK